MTKDEINRAVAEKVMGWHEEPICTSELGTRTYWCDPTGKDIMLCGSWNPYHQRTQAMSALDNFKYYRIERWMSTYTCKILVNPKWVSGQSDILSVAICLAALKAKEWE